MLTCPDGGALNLDLAASPLEHTGRRWLGICLDCGCTWDFDDG